MNTCPYCVWPEFLGAAAFLPGVVTGDGIHTELGLVARRNGAATGASVDVLVRPDDISFAPAPDGHGVLVDRVFRGSEVRRRSSPVTRARVRVERGAGRPGRARAGRPSRHRETEWPPGKPGGVSAGRPNGPRVRMASRVMGRTPGHRERCLRSSRTDSPKSIQ